MDPAGPLYANCGIETRLNHTDAQFVQAIHCNAEFPCCGTLEPMGHVDFYANGGEVQPGCEPILRSDGAVREKGDGINCISLVLKVFRNDVL